MLKSKKVIVFLDKVLNVKNLMFYLLVKIADFRVNSILFSS